MELEIKYRAYHLAEKKMCAVELIRFGENAGAFLIGAERSNDKIYDRHIVYAPGDGRYCLAKEFKLMQFIGLYDNTTWKELTVDEQKTYLAVGGKKNKWAGREIYAHDIVSIAHNGVKSLKNNYEVVWDSESAGFYMIDAKRDGDDFGVYTKRIESIRKEEMRVAGNRFENPELINAPVKKVSKKATA